MREISTLLTSCPSQVSSPTSNLSSKLKSLLTSSSQSSTLDSFATICTLRESLISGLNAIYTKYLTDYLTYIHTYQPTKKNSFSSPGPALDPAQLHTLTRCAVELTEQASSNAVYLLIYDAIERFINKLWEQISKIPESEYKRQECLLAAYRLIEVSASEVNKLTQDILLYEMRIGIENVSKLLFQEKVVDELDRIIDRGSTSLYLIRKEIRFYKREIRQMFNSIYSNRKKDNRQTKQEARGAEYRSDTMSLDDLVAYIESNDNSTHNISRRRSSQKSTGSSSSDSQGREPDKYALLEQEIRDFQIKLESRPVQIPRYKLKLNPEWIESLRREIWARS